jgi:hypothetical protein
LHLEEDREFLTALIVRHRDLIYPALTVHYKSIYSTELHVTSDSIQSNLLGRKLVGILRTTNFILLPANKYLNKYKFEEQFSGDITL